MELKGSETEKNLLKSFAGESQVRNKYNYFASVAKKEGYEQISAIFTETADNEKEHAKIFFKYLKEGNGEALEITAKYSSGMISTTLDNLKAAADGENEEWSELYPELKESLEKKVSKNSRFIQRNTEVEEEYERYRKLYQNLGDIFKR